MMATRRAVLQGFLATLGMASLSPIISYASEIQLTKYEKALALFNQIITNYPKVEPGNMFSNQPLSSEDQTLVNQLLGFISGEDFKISGDEEEAKQVSAVFTDSPGTYIKAIKASPEVCDSCFAITLVRNMLKERHLLIIPDKTPNWDTFAHKYMNLILKN